MQPPETPAFELRTATAESLRAFVEPLPAAFAEDYPDAEFEADRHLFEPDRVVGVFEGERAVGCAGAISMQLTVPGGEVSAAAVTLVGVLPTHRRRGILRSLMRHQLDDVLRRGEPVAILWASEGAIYQRFGYGLATCQGTIEIDPRRSAFLHPVTSVGRVRFVGPEEALELLPPVYERSRRLVPGALARSAGWWRWGTLRDSEEARRDQGPKWVAVLEVEGRTVGYAIYRARASWDDRGPENRLTVLEVVADSAEAERELWRWLLDIDLVGRLRAVRQPVPPPLFLMLAEPRRLGLTVADGLWLRLVDLPVALRSRGYAAPGELLLEVTDEACPWNAGLWRVSVTAPDAPAAVEMVERSGGDPPDLLLDVADLGAAYLGGIRWAELAGADRVRVRRPGAIALADRMFAAERTPWCSTMF